MYIHIYIDKVYNLWIISIDYVKREFNINVNLCAKIKQYSGDSLSITIQYKKYLKAERKYNHNIEYIYIYI